MRCSFFPSLFKYSLFAASFIRLFAACSFFSFSLSTNTSHFTPYFSALTTSLFCVFDFSLSPNPLSPLILLSIATNYPLCKNCAISSVPRATYKIWIHCNAPFPAASLERLSKLHAWTLINNTTEKPSTRFCGLVGWGRRETEIHLLLLVTNHYLKFQIVLNTDTWTKLSLSVQDFLLASCMCCKDKFVPLLFSFQHLPDQEFPRVLFLTAFVQMLTFICTLFLWFRASSPVCVVK